MRAIRFGENVERAAHLIDLAEQAIVAVGVAQGDPCRFKPGRGSPQLDTCRVEVGQNLLKGRVWLAHLRLPPVESKSTRTQDGRRHVAGMDSDVPTGGILAHRRKCERLRTRADAHPVLAAADSLSNRSVSSGVARGVECADGASNQRSASYNITGGEVGRQVVAICHRRISAAQQAHENPTGVLPDTERVTTVTAWRCSRMGARGAGAVHDVAAHRPTIGERNTRCRDKRR